MGKRRTARIGLIAGVIAAAVAMARGRLRRFEIVEDSMLPALASGDYVVAVRRSEAPLRGEIVIFEAPGRPGFDVVKRVVGLPGESVEIGRGAVHIDGSVLAEPWADGPTFPEGRWDVGGHAVFVLGDRRAASAGDGRQIGPVDLPRVRWRVTWRYWPPGRIGRI
ncbi:MAG: signal peptidase I [Acidimicrobiia bacterium]